MTSNPMINSRVTENIILEGAPMTIQGAVNKSLVLLAIIVACACVSWGFLAQGFSDKTILLTWVGLIGGLILAIITSFKPEKSPMTAPAYAICEGLVVGSVSYMYNAMYQGIVANAIGITLLALFSMLMLYKTRIIQASATFRKVIFTSTVAIAIFYLAGLIGALVGHPMTIFNGGLAGIIISVVICAIAALNFILDFDFIENGERNCLPQYFEWYGAFTLMVTVIWLYFEILKLLAQLQRRR